MDREYGLGSYCIWKEARCSQARQGQGLQGLWGDVPHCELACLFSFFVLDRGLGKDTRELCWVGFGFAQAGMDLDLLSGLASDFSSLFP